MNNPKISVIIPVYNNTVLIKQCLDSILNQTLKEIEIICVNDGSTDNTSEVLHRLSQQDNRIKIIDKKNEWQSYARKVGLDNAKGEYIMFCDHDDEYPSNTSFEEIYNKAKATDVDIVAFDFYFKNGENDVIERKFLPNPPKKEKFNYRDIEKINQSNTGLWLLLIKKKLFDSYDNWYFPKRMYYEDTPLHFQLLFRAKNITYIEKPIYKYIINANSVTNYPKTDKKIRDVYISTKKTLDILEEENITDKNIKIRLLLYFIEKLSLRLDNAFLKKNNAEDIMNSIKLFDISSYEIDKLVYEEIPIQIFFVYKAIKKFDIDRFRDYINKKRFKQQNRRIREQSKRLQEQNRKIKIQDIAINRIQNSWSYRIGKIFELPFEFLFKLYKYISDYNLIKKSNLFDTKYYLSENDDVKNAKMDPIKHYLQFGWKEGRNPSAEFNSNEYLNKRPDVKVSGICPLVHYIKFGKEEK